MNDTEQVEELAPGEVSSSNWQHMQQEVLSRVDPTVTAGTGVNAQELQLMMIQEYIETTGDLSFILPLTAMIKGNAYSLVNFPMFRPLFNAHNNPMVITYQCCRQVGKTESLSALMCLRARMRPNYHSLAVAPRHEQAVRISTYKTIPFLKESMHSPCPNFYVDDMKRVGKTSIHLINDNSIDFIGCYLSPDAARGFAKDVVLGRVPGY
jgi:hypothetical protein